MRTKVLFLIALMVQTIVYFAAVSQSIEDYKAWTIANQDWINRLLSETSGQVRISHVPYLRSLQGKLAVSFGVALTISWIILGVDSLLSIGSPLSNGKTKKVA